MQDVSRPRKADPRTRHVLGRRGRADRHRRRFWVRQVHARPHRRRARNSRQRIVRRLSGHGLIGLPPSPHGVHDGPQALPQLREGVLDAGRDLRVDPPNDEPRVLHAAQVRCEDLLRDAPDAALEGLEPHRAVQEQVPHYEQLPLAADKGHAGLHRAGGKVASLGKLVVSVLGIADFISAHCISPVPIWLLLSTYSTL